LGGVVGGRGGGERSLWGGVWGVFFGRWVWGEVFFLGGWGKTPPPSPSGELPRMEKKRKHKKDRLYGLQFEFLEERNACQLFVVLRD